MMGSKSEEVAAAAFAVIDDRVDSMFCNPSLVSLAVLHIFFMPIPCGFPFHTGYFP